MGRSLLVGAMTGLLGGALVFFWFGFIGFSGASFSIRVENGWDAVLDTGLAKGLVAGLGLAAGLSLGIVVWAVLGRRVDSRQARPWLSLLAAGIVVLSNLESLRSARGWDVAGLFTVLAIAMLVGAVVWIVLPWVLREPGHH